MLTNFRVSWGEESSPESKNSIGLTYRKSALSVAADLRESYPNVRVWEKVDYGYGWSEVR